MGLVSPARAQPFVFDFDNDGVADENDLCPLTTDLSGPIPTETLCEGCLSDADTVQGCNATDVLDCKPGPNHHDRKFGVTPKAVDKFVRKAAWAKKCAYDPPPPPPPPETSGDASDVEELVLNLPGASFTVPPAALPDGTPITFSFESPSVIEPGVLGASETVVTPVYHLAFSVDQRANEILTLEIQVPAGLTEGIYGLFQVVSERTKEAPASPEWAPLVGAYDESAGTYTVELGSAPELLSIFVVTRTESPESASVLQTLGTYFAEARRWTSKLIDAAIRMVGPSHATAGRDVEDGLLSRGWAAYCRPELFPPEQQSLCQPGSPELQALAEAMYESAATLDGKGLERGLIYTENPIHMLKSTLPTAYFNPGGAPVSEFFLVLMRAPDFGGSYLSTPGLVQVGSNRGASTGTHELVHTVQHVELPRWAYAPDWIVESLAAAAETWAPGWTGSSEDYRYLWDGPDGPPSETPVWRNWELPLNRSSLSNCTLATATSDCFAAYTLAELWLDADPTLATLPNLLNDFPADPAQVPPSEHYIRFDQQWQLAGGPPLSDAFVSVIETRSTDDEYPHCGTRLDPNNPDSPRQPFDTVECTTTPCELNETLDLALQRMSAKCFRPIVTLPPSEACPGEETRSITFGGDAAANRYIVDGTTYAPGETIENPPTAFKLWAIDMGINNPLAFSEGSVVISTSCPPDLGDVTLVRQSYTVHASLDVDCSSGPEGSGYTNEAINSYDDLSRPSERRVNEPLEDWVVTEIEPIGFGSVNLTRQMSFTIPSPRPPLCLSYLEPGDSADATANLTVDTVAIDEPNRKGIQITGSLVASRNQAGGLCGQPGSKAAASYLVQFEVDSPKQVYVNYSCDTTYVSLPATQSGSLVLDHYGGSEPSFNSCSGVPEDQLVMPNWICEPYSATVGQGVWTVLIKSSTYPDEADGSHTKTRNATFTIEVVEEAP